MRTPNPAIAQTHCWALGGQSTEMFLMSPCRQSNVYCRAESLSQLKSRSNWPSSAPQVSVGKSTVIVAEPKWSPRVAPCPRAPNNFIFFACRLCEAKMLSPCWIYFWTTPCRALAYCADFFLWVRFFGFPFQIPKKFRASRGSLSNVGRIVGCRVVPKPNG